MNPPEQWESDLELVSHFLDTKVDHNAQSYWALISSYLLTFFFGLKESLEAQHRAYIRSNPALQALLRDFMQAILLEKPTDIYAYAKQFFSSYTNGQLSGL